MSKDHLYITAFIETLGIDKRRSLQTDFIPDDLIMIEDTINIKLGF